MSYSKFNYTNFIKDNQIIFFYDLKGEARVHLNNAILALFKNDKDK